MRLTRSLLAVCAAAVTLSLAGTAFGQWRWEFAERPEEWGGDIRYVTLEQPDRSSLRVGCVRNRIERVLIVFPRIQGTAAPISPTPEVRYSFDGRPAQVGDWPRFESGTLEVPRGARSAAITREIAKSRTFQVRATAVDGGWLGADFNLEGGDALINKMLTECGVQ